MRIRRYVNGALSLVVLTHAPFLYPQSPIAVEDASAGTEYGVPVTEPYAAPLEPSGEAIEGQYQMQLLQQEVMELRGLLEELTHEIKRIRSTQEDRYLELDGRLLGLDARMSGDPIQSATSDSVDAPPAQQGDEKTLYDTSLDLIRSQQYDLAITQLRAVIDQYPNGVYTPNVYYWLGEVYAAKPEPELENARQAFAQVIQFFPEHRKVPDAAFKLGKVYHLLGDCARAADLLGQVINLHKGKSVATLAESYLRDKVSCTE